MKKLLLVLLIVAGGLLLVPLGGSAPDSYSVVKGDTLGRIAQRQGVTVDDLRQWNGIEGDLIEIGQQLALGPSGPGTPVWQLLRERFLPERAPEEAVEASEPVPEKRTRRRAAHSNAEPLPPSDIDAEAPSYDPLHMPAAKPCLDPTTGTGGGSFGRSQGLDHEQINGAVAAFQKQTFRCFEGRPETQGEIVLSIVVGCDGRVLRSAVEENDTGDADFGVCVAEVFRHAPFPAHARDEAEFAVPLRFTPVR